jgi:hypothetical protein
VEQYNSLPGLFEARDQFESAQSSDVLSELGQLLVKRGVQNMLGVTLLHNHFLLEQDEKLVIVDSVAVPVSTKVLGIGASSWRFVKEGIAPYEFIRSDAKVFLTSHTEAFLIEFRIYARETGTSRHSPHLLSQSRIRK